jgi:hypothetical protein
MGENNLGAFIASVFSSDAAIDNQVFPEVILAGVTDEYAALLDSHGLRGMLFDFGIHVGIDHNPGFDNAAPREWLLFGLMNFVIAVKI